MSLPDTSSSEGDHFCEELDDILHDFVKATVLTQPTNVFAWAAAYFKALSEGEPLPVTETQEGRRGEGLTPGLLKALHKQLGYKETCSKDDIQDKWKGLCLPTEQLESLLQMGNFSADIVWMEFFALGCSVLGGTLMSALKFACEILTEDEEGAPARIPFRTFVQLYTYLTRLDGDMSKEQVNGFLTSLQPEVNKQNGMIAVSNFYQAESEDRNGEEEQESINTIAE